MDTSKEYKKAKKDDVISRIREEWKKFNQKLEELISEAA